jgi:hypothetical protein
MRSEDSSMTTIDPQKQLEEPQLLLEIAPTSGLLLLIKSFDRA